MSIWGKILGGAAGFALGGPLGALVGALAGHAVDRMSHVGGGAHDDPTRQVSFTIGVIVLSAKMAKADGHVTRDEIDAFKRLFQVPENEMKNVGRVFNFARRDAAGFEPYAKQIAQLFRDQPVILEDLLGALFQIARADGELHSAEITYLRQVAEIFGFSAADFDRIQAGHTNAVDDNPYQVLGVDAAISDAELKTVYHRIVRDNHPDRLIANGMPQEFIDVANEKLAAINDAYDRIERLRGRAS